MPIVKASPDQYLLVGRRGTLENRGSAVQAVLMPGSVHVLVPSGKQEAAFEFTQETSDGIPLRFKGIVIYRITDPVAAARQFDFGSDAGVARITTLLTHVCLGELRDAVSHMTMSECIEGRKTTLSGVASAALQATIAADDGAEHGWGVSIEVAQVAQVFIVDSQLRQQLEAEVRNEIKVRSDRSDLEAHEATELAAMASEGRVDEQRLANDQADLRRQAERFAAEMAQQGARLEAETPIRLERIAREVEVLRDELAMREIQNGVKALEVEHELLLPRAQQAMRLEALPIEQTPEIVASAASVLHGTNLSIYGEDSQLVGQVGPVLDLIIRRLEDAAAPDSRATPGAPKPT